MGSSWTDQRGKWLRRAIGAVVCVVVLGIILVLISRLAPRSPLTIVVLCVVAVLTMKLAERQVRQWLDRWAKRQVIQTGRRKLPGEKEKLPG